MKKTITSFVLFTLLIGCKSTSAINISKTNQIIATIDLINVKDDKVMVTIQPPLITTDEITFHLPKIIPGTYSEDNYGTQVEQLKAYSTTGNELLVIELDDNSWTIKDAKNLGKITYWVNDTFDSEKGSNFGEDDIFSPAGTNINEGKNFMINSHGFIGYFLNKSDVPYQMTILHPENMWGATSLTDTDASNTSDVFSVSRYNELIDNPIMYSKPDYTSFVVDGMEILFSVYSPSGKHSAKSLSGDLEKMMRAQKTFLGSINANKKYTVLLYLSDMKKKDAKGFGALEHNTSTTVVFPEMMPTSALGKQIIDVVSHEFFHIVTPLSVHSNEIHYFDFTSPKMSKHLWMYEGVTEYFANLFQVNQGLITETEFYDRMVGKIEGASQMNDTMSFTEMSANVLKKTYKDQYLNVYEKGALIAMCIDIEIREKSNGQRGILDLMQKLTAEYGPKKPFTDDELFAKITELTYPEVGAFLTKHVEGTTPISYEYYFEKVGVAKGKSKVAANPFMNGNEPVVTVNQTTKELYIRPSITLGACLSKIGLQPEDTILAINEVNYNLDTVYEMMTSVEQWKEGQTITFKIKRNGKEQTISGEVQITFNETESYKVTNPAKQTLNTAWLKG